jgi:hypothetical protein
VLRLTPAGRPCRPAGSRYWSMAEGLNRDEARSVNRCKG